MWWGCNPVESTGVEEEEEEEVWMRGGGRNNRGALKLKYKFLCKPNVYLLAPPFLMAPAH